LFAAELKKYGISPRKSLGQHFLVDTNAREKLVRYAEIQAGDTVLEVGAGIGFLTADLLRFAKKVIAIEKDPTLAEILKRRLGRFSKLHIIMGDALEVKLPAFDRLASTPPYQISSKLLLRIAERKFAKAVLTLQDEFAKRLVAEPGTEDYGRITVMTRHRVDVQLRDLISRSAFIPQPRVNSRIVEIQPRKDLTRHGVADERVFKHLVRGLFTQRRRVLRGALRHYLDKVGIGMTDSMLSVVHGPASRVFEMSLEDFERLANELAPTLNSVVEREHL
jgi:16S rRNA (adenine1518-N6/adenine1519-N6)-dimethyltransferase